MATLIEAVEDGMSMWKRRHWTGEFWLSVRRMQISCWDRSVPMDPKIIQADYVLTKEDVLATDWEYILLGG
jgi:hypothetical protein